MLKHISRSESREMEVFDSQRSSMIDSSFQSTFEQELQLDYSMEDTLSTDMKTEVAAGDKTLSLSTPTLQKILDKRRSLQSEQVEFTEEVERDNSKLVIYRRKKDTCSNSLNYETASDYGCAPYSQRQQEELDIQPQQQPLGYRTLDGRARDKRGNFKQKAFQDSGYDAYRYNNGYHRALSAQPAMYSHRGSIHSIMSTPVSLFQYRENACSVSANSSVSNVDCAIPSSRSQATFTTIPRSTVARSNVLLENIYEVNETEREGYEKGANKSVLKHRFQRCKCVALFLTVLVAVLCIVSGFLHYYVGYYPQTVVLNQADVHLLEESSWFCGGIEATAKEGGVRLISFMRNNLRPILKYTRKEKVTLLPQTYWKRQFSLLKGSKINFKVATPDLIEMLIFIGEKNYSIWSQRKESETYSQKQFCCSNTAATGAVMYFDALHDGTYVFVIHSAVEVFPVKSTVEFEFLRKTFDFTQTAVSCTSLSTCSISRSLDSNEVVAMEVPLINEVGTISQSSELTWKCEARVWLYCLVFAGSFLLAFLFVVFVYYLAVNVVFRTYFKDADPVTSYENFGRTSSEVCRRPGNLSTRPSELTISTDLRSTPRDIHYPIKNENIATLYRETQEEQADSGISVDPDSSPTTTQGETILGNPILRGSTQQLMQLQEARVGQLNYQNKIQLVAGPRIEHLLQRPPSVMSQSSVIMANSYPDGLENSFELQEVHPNRPEVELFL